MFIWTGTEWVAASAAGGASLNNFSYTATAGQTTFTGSDENTNNLSYTVDNIIVTLNGVVLEGGGTDYTATDGSSIVLTSGAALSDEVNIVAFKTFTTADMVSSANGGAFQGNVDFNAGIDVTGNITVTGTVDGVDVAAFKSSFDALDLAGDYVNVTGDTMTGDLGLSGADVTFGDNDKAIFGAGSDLAVFSNGTDSFIQEYTTGGHLYVDATNVRIRNRNDNTLRLQTSDSGAVDLYYSGSTKLATTATGVDITGTLTSDGLKLDAANSEVIIGNNASYQGKIKYNDVLGEFEFRNTYDATFRGYAFYRGSTDKTSLRLDGNGDISFYEDTGTTPKFFWDASAESLGLGTTSPTADIHMVKADDINEIIMDANRPSAGQLLGRNRYYWNGTEVARMEGDAGSDTTNKDDGILRFLTKPSGSSIAEAMRIDSSGRVLIGTTTSFADANSDDLQISGSGDTGMMIKSGTSGYGSIYFGDATSGGARNAGILRYHHGSDNMQIWTAEGERLRVDSNGNVGIGTSSPTSKLTVNDANGIAIRVGDIASAPVSQTAVYVGASTSALSGGNGDLVLIPRTSDSRSILFYTGSGTAAERMRIDSSGNVGIGTSNAGARITLGDASSADSTNMIRSYRGAGTSTYAEFGEGSGGAKLEHVGGGPVYFKTGGAERMRIDSSGNLLVGKTTTSVGTAGTLIAPTQTNITNNTAVPQITTNNLGWGGVSIDFLYTGARRGYIAVDSTSVAYVTSSDYRLKTDAQPMTGASARVQALNPVNFEWISTGERVDGFLAHEAQAIVPEAVTGTKDAVDADGNPEYQGIDQSKLVPLLTAALQEALTKIDALETRITALEG
jgi:hypothetical protein